jgi:hypothetical protein
MNNPKTAFGITSKCHDGSHIYMGDIDTDISLNKVKSICMKFQLEYNLSTIYIIGTNHGYNLYSLDKIPLKLIFIINNSDNNLDKVYNKLQFLNRGSYTLRTLPAGDKFVIARVQSANRVFVRSNAHRIYFNNFFALDVPKDFMFDESEKIELCRFHNTKYGWKFNDE